MALFDLLPAFRLSGISALVVSAVAIAAPAAAQTAAAPSTDAPPTVTRSVHDDWTVRCLSLIHI